MGSCGPTLSSFVCCASSMIVAPSYLTSLLRSRVPSSGSTRRKSPRARMQITAEETADAAASVKSFEEWFAAALADLESAPATETPLLTADAVATKAKAFADTITKLSKKPKPTPTPTPKPPKKPAAEAGETAAEDGAAADGAGSGTESENFRSSGSEQPDSRFAAEDEYETGSAEGGDDGNTRTRKSTESASGSAGESGDGSKDEL